MASKYLNLSNLIPELIQRIAFYVATDSLIAAPNLTSLMLTCRAVYAKLAFDAAPYLYDRIFRAKFDVSAPRRRFGEEVLKTANLARELKKRYVAMGRIRRCEIYGDYALNDLWLAYLMLLESDGKNERQLIMRARVVQYVVDFVGTRVREGSELNHNWPVETDSLALAVWILWLTWDQHVPTPENEHVFYAILDILHPFVIAAFRYSTLLVPDTHYGLPLQGTPESNPPRCTETVHGRYPVYRDLRYPNLPNVEHFGKLHTIAAPPLAGAAMLIHFATRQLHPFQASPNMRLRRSDLPPGVMEATVEDMDEFNERAITRLVPRCPLNEGWACSFAGEEDVSKPSPTSPCSIAILATGRSPTAPSTNSSLQHEHDWLRLTHCYNPWLESKLKFRIFTPGMLDGLWEGRQFIYDVNQYVQLLGEPNMPENMSGAYPHTYQRALYMRLREHHCIDSLPAGFGQYQYDSEAEGLGVAFFPPNFHFSEGNGELMIYDPAEEDRTYYETYVPGKPNSHMRAGGCQECNPDTPIPPAQMREYQKVLATEFSREGEFHDTVNDGCITDIVITGETDEVHSRAWGYYKFIGRVRDMDGFVVLLRIPVEPTASAAGTFIFRGYIHSNQNFVGRWRSTEDTTRFAAVEGAFSLCKRID